ncbi:MAG: endonuclease/exonuclease/phosphatase family protein, partial [Okeania sp. SIO2H7]|nr:endonuclease/exonuclease/phosphatase family protein [Okeania sp. SIO2H7]
LPLSNTSVEFLGGIEIPTLVADVTKNNRVISLVATHPLPPLSQDYLFLRNRHLKELAKYVNTLENPVAVLGDLNLTMWSPFYRDLVRTSGLKNSRHGYGVLPTWPTQLPLLYIPLDHCLVSEDVGVINTRIGENVGSDHLPVITDIAF